jgi:hypothetical protein
MRGKIVFVVGLATGYVLGTRAGRERYEQIKSGAQKLWNTKPVQAGVQQAQDFAGARVDQLASTASNNARKALAALIGREPKSSPAQSSSAPSKPAQPPRSAPTPPASDESGDDETPSVPLAPSSDI